MTSLNILDNIKIGGHRGMGCTDHPFTLKRPQPDTRPTENTSESVKQAFQKGCDFVEVDVVLTKDKTPVCLHNVIPEDHFFDKIPDKPINLLDYHELLKYQCGRTLKSKVSTLGEILETTKRHSKKTNTFDINIELKGNQSSNQKATGLRELCKAVSKSVTNSKLEPQRILISSFCLEMLLTMVKEIPNCQYGILFAEENGTKPLFSNYQKDFGYQSINFTIENINEIEKYCNLNNVDFSIIRYLHPEIKTVNSEILDYILVRNKELNLWTLYEREPPRLNNIIINALHKDTKIGIITDFVDLKKSLLINA
jgi:glycerophosphoryl diester phosphodiesterase